MHYASNFKQWEHFSEKGVAFTEYVLNEIFSDWKNLLKYFLAIRSY